jgi:hypothetical protein
MTSDGKFVTAYSPAEAETLRRCNAGEQVSESDLLLMLSTDLRIMESFVEGISGIMTREELWSLLDDLSVEIYMATYLTDKWRAKFLGYSDKLTWRPCGPPEPREPSRQ